MKLKQSKFQVLYEDVYSRFQSGGLVAGDIVKFRSNVFNHPAIKEAMPEFKQIIQELKGSDLNLKVGAVRTIRPGQQYNLQNTIYGYSVDVIQEYAPGLFRTPVTVPIEVLERVEDTGNNRNPQPVPDSLKRKERINIKPEDASKYKDPHKLAANPGRNSKS
jgi:hypothetical protein